MQQRLSSIILNQTTAVRSVDKVYAEKLRNQSEGKNGEDGNLNTNMKVLKYTSAARIAMLLFGLHTALDTKQMHPKKNIAGVDAQSRG